MAKSSVSARVIYAGAAATLLILLASIYLSFQRFVELRNADLWNRHTYQVLLETGHVMRGLINIQTGTRGFLQAGDESFLAPYSQGVQEYREHYTQALILTRDHVDQQKRLQSLDRQYSKWMTNHIEPLIRMRRSTKNTATAMQLVAPGARQRKIAMDAMKQTVAAIEKTETDLLRQRSQRQDSLQALTQSALLANAVFAAVLVAGLSLYVVSGTRRLQRKQEELLEEAAQRERAEREAKVLNDHNKLILEAARDGITGVNQAGRITFFNPAAEAITGYSEAEVIGKPQQAILHCSQASGDPYPAEEDPIAATLRKGKPHHTDDDVICRKDGKTIPIEVTSAPLVVQPNEDRIKVVWDKSGYPVTGHSLEGVKIVGAVTVFRDITERKQAEMGLQELASIVKFSDDAIIGLSLEGTIRRWNQAASNVYGFSEFEMIGTPISKLVPPEQQDELDERLKKIRRQEPVERYETTHLRKDGTKAQVIVSLSPIMDQHERVIGVSCISRETFRSRTQRQEAQKGRTADKEADAAAKMEVGSVPT